MKKITALLLFVLLALGCACPALAAGDAAAADFKPVMRFVASSDTHVRADDDVTAQRIGRMMESAYAIADSDARYTNIDALLVVGDLTQSGIKPEYDRFERAVDEALRSGTQFLGVVAKNHDGYNQSRKAIRDRIAAMTGHEADFHVVIGGYHFIGMSASKNPMMHYDAGQMRWLKTQLDEAVQDDPDKPVFMMHHEPSIETVYGSMLYDGWGVPYFSSLLRRYPQVVEICGHSHYPLNDPRSVWQGAYTAIGTGAIAYTELTVDEMRAYHPADFREAANCWIIDVNAQHDLRMRGMDVDAQRILCDFVIPNPADPDNRGFTPSRRKAGSEAPAFAEGASPTVERTANGCRVSVSPAQSAVGDPVILYRIRVKDAHGVTVARMREIPPYYRAVEQGAVEAELRSVPAGDYTVTIVAENAWGKQSQPMTVSVHVEGKSALQILPEYIWQRLLDLKDYFVRLFR